MTAESATDPVDGTAALTFTDAVPVTTMDTDSVWQLAVQSITSLPAPTGGTGTEEHTPTSWSRTALSPTDTLAVWRSQRTRTFTDGAFILATVWGTPVKVSDRLTVLADAIIPDGHQLVGAGSLLTAPSSVVPDAFMVLYIAGDTVLDGDDPPTLGDATLAIQRALYTTNNQWRINEDGAGDFLALYEAGGTYEDRLFHVQPSLDTVISLPASSIDTGASNTDRLRWNLTAAEQLQFQQLEQDGRFILFITEPPPVVVTVPLAADSVTSAVESTAALTFTMPVAVPLAAASATSAVAGTAALTLVFAVALAAASATAAVEGTAALSFTMPPAVTVPLAAASATDPVEGTAALTLDRPVLTFADRILPAGREVVISSLIEGGAASLYNDTGDGSVIEGDNPPVLPGVSVIISRIYVTGNDQLRLSQVDVDNIGQLFQAGVYADAQVHVQTGITEVFGLAASDLDTSRTAAVRLIYNLSAAELTAVQGVGDGDRWILTITQPEAMAVTIALAADSATAAVVGSAALTFDGPVTVPLAADSATDPVAGTAALSVTVTVPLAADSATAAAEGTADLTFDGPVFIPLAADSATAAVVGSAALTFTGPVFVPLAADSATDPGIWRRHSQGDHAGGCHRAHGGGLRYRCGCWNRQPDRHYPGDPGHPHRQGGRALDPPARAG